MHYSIPRLDLVCPYCGHEFDRSDIDEYFNYETIDSGVVYKNCPNCNKKLKFDRTVVDKIESV